MRKWKKQAACIFHKGSYDTFHKSYAVILEYIEENGYEICGNIREVYIDGVWNKEVRNANLHNLKNISVHIPLNIFSIF